MHVVDLDSAVIRKNKRTLLTFIFNYNKGYAHGRKTDIQRTAAPKQETGKRTAEICREPLGLNMEINRVN